ncbi:DMT family transporter [Pseudoruegeria sp. HB172150]|uniref:DMT family transporter n=1 Tax=Pseudoruegeria sp. HB172150 TaxID=2721164 RepID=UPI0015567FB4|nr:DMT family transporter [Pseudoruegeria sp. HB172150]
MNADRPLTGILLMLAFCVLAPLGDSLAKLIGDAVPLTQLITLRFTFQALILIPLAWASGISLSMPPRLLALTALRTLLHMTGIGAMFLSLRYLPLADAVAIAFVMPFLMLLLGWLVLGEEVGPRRLAACAVGFVGTLLVVQPSFAAVGPPALLPLLVAVVFSFFMLVTRTVAKHADPIALQGVSGVMAMVLLLPLMAFGAFHEIPVIEPVSPTPEIWAYLVALGVLGTFAHLMMTWSLRFAPAATLAPMQYLEIPFATLIGWLIFRDFPNGLALLGIAITMASGLYIILRERNLSRVRIKVPAPPS